MLAQEMTAEVVASSGWFLDHAWLIPIIPAVAFVLIIFFGKKLPMKGSELGVLSMLVSLAFAGGAAWQWIQRVNSVVDVAHEAVKEGAHHVAPLTAYFVFLARAGARLGLSVASHARTGTGGRLSHPGALRSRRHAVPPGAPYGASVRAGASACGADAALPAVTGHAQAALLGE